MRPLVLFATVFVAVLTFAQDQKPVVSPTARLIAAKTIYFKNGGGNDIPFNVISSGIDGWGKYILADSEQSADIVVEVTSYADDNGNLVPPEAKGSAKTHPDVVNIKMVVYDSRTHLSLWNSSERPKGAIKEKGREENIADAAEKLLQRFHNRVEPPGATPADTTSEKSK
jgi:hypothetical protein